MRDVATITFIINPFAGGRMKDVLEEKFKHWFTASGYAVNIFYTRYPTHAYTLALEQVDAGTDIVVAVGGDGTVNEVARALVNTGTALGVIPAGSGNGFARHFNFPRSIDRALKILSNGKTSMIDVGYMNNKPFFCTSGIGFDAETGYYFSRYGKRGLLSYAISFLRVFRNYRPQTYRLEIDGEIRTFEAFLVNIANISQFGYHFYIAPEASADDGFLDLVVVRRFPRWKGLIFALQSYMGTIGKNHYVYQAKASNIKLLEKEKGRIIHIDGDPDVADGTIEYRIEPKCLKVIMP